MAFKRLLIEKFAPAVDFYFWVDVVNAKDFSLPWYGKHLERHSMELLLNLWNICKYQRGTL